jgi:uncharacterized membrane protein
MLIWSPLFNALHALAAVIWVGGMFFAYVVLRPAAGALEAPLRLSLWNRVFDRFLLWVWATVAVLLVSGYYAVYADFGGFAQTGLHVTIMHGLGWTMIGIFAFLYFIPFRRFRTAVAAQDWPSAGRLLTVIRRIVAFNLMLGLFTVAVGSSGRLW